MARDGNGGNGTAFILPFLTEAATAVAAIKTVAPNFFGGPPPLPAPQVTPAPQDAMQRDPLLASWSGGGYQLPGDFANASLGPMIPGVAGPLGAFNMMSVPGAGSIAGAIERVVPRWLARVAGGAAIAATIWEEYKRLRGSGVNHKTAKRHAHLRAGLHVRRRRMRVTNVHALKRASHRVKGFMKLVHHVQSSLPHRTVHHAASRGGFFRKAHHKGDLAPQYDPEAEETYAS